MSYKFAVFSKFSNAVAALLFVLITTAGTSAWSQSFVNWENLPLHAVDLSPDGVTLAVVNLPDNRVELFDLSSGLPHPIEAIQVGLDPVSVRWRPDGTQLWVVNHISDTISVIDYGTRRVVATIQTNDEPFDLVFAGSPERAFVSCSQANQVQVINTTTLAVTNTIDINGEDPRALAVNGAGTEVYVAIFESGNATTLVGGSDRRNLTPNVVGGDAHNGSEGETNDPSFTVGPYSGTNPPPNDGGSFTPAINPDYLQGGSGSWSNVGGDDIDWTRDSGGTPSNRTGPTVDHTTGTSSGFYLYTEASGRNRGYPNKTALLESPCISLVGYTGADWTFSFHMAGNAMGNLHAEIAPGCGTSWSTELTLSGAQQASLRDPYGDASVDLSGYVGTSVRLRFRGVTANSWSGDMTIDDVHVMGTSN